MECDEPSDETGVDRLVGAAGRRRRDLVRAAALLAKEHRESDRACRLLTAAATGSPVRRLTEDERRWFDQTEQLDAVPVEQAYATLLDLQPELGTFETSFTASAANEHDAELLWDRLTDGLDRLLGPDADVSDPLLRTHATWHVARVYLATKMDLLDEVDKED